MLRTTGTTKELQGELNEFTNVLIHAESHMRKTIAENVQVAMCEFLPHNCQTMPMFWVAQHSVFYSLLYISM